MRFILTLQTKFILSVVLLLGLLITMILFVIEQRERKAIFDEQMSKGVLIAQNISQLNSRSLFIHGDQEGVKRSVENQISQSLLYIVFYDRSSQPYVAKSYADPFEQFYPQSHLGVDVVEGDYFYEQKNIPLPDLGKTFRVLEIEIPVFLEGSPRKWGSLKIGHSLEEMYRENQHTRLMLMLIGVGGILIGVAGAVILAKTVTGPLKKLVDGTIQISKGDFSQRIGIVSHDEIGNLAHSFNAMSRQLQVTQGRMEEANRKLIQADKLASIGRISTGIAHEIRNPLTSVKLNIQRVLESKALDEAYRSELSISQEGIVQIEKFIKEMLNYARVTELSLDRFEIEQIIEESVKMMADTLRAKNIRLHRDFKKELPPVVVDGDRMRQVILNLLQNACEAIGKDGKITIGLSLVKRDGNAQIRVEIADNGCGIPKKDWENIFEPFFTTKSSGIGLGLANARKIIDLHKGTIRAKAKTGKGSCFEICIPCEDEQ